ncbi:MAG: hypothetical protein K0Q52_3477, partial [Microbacterium sp.]|nr:hypothetical protein [Microbacterium sp.]
IRIRVGERDAMAGCKSISEMEGHSDDVRHANWVTYVFPHATDPTRQALESPRSLRDRGPCGWAEPAVISPRSFGLEGHAQDDSACTACRVGVLDATHPDLLGHSLGGAIVWVDDRDQFPRADVFAYKVAARRRRLGRDAVALPSRSDVVPHLEFADSVDFLPCQTAVSDKFARVRLDDPEPVAVFVVVPFVPCDPRSRLFAGLRLRVELHDLGITQQTRHLIEVRWRHRTETNSRRISGKHVSTIADGLSCAVGIREKIEAWTRTSNPKLSQISFALS